MHTPGQPNARRAWLTWHLGGSAGCWTPSAAMHQSASRPEEQIQPSVSNMNVQIAFLLDQPALELSSSAKLLPQAENAVKML